MPITSLAAFLVPENDDRNSNSSARGLWDTSQAADRGGCVIVATGWEDGRWKVTPCFSVDGDDGGACVLPEGEDGVAGPELEQVDGDTGALGSGAVLHMVHQVKTMHAFFIFSFSDYVVVVVFEAGGGRGGAERLRFVQDVFTAFFFLGTLWLLCSLRWLGHGIFSGKYIFFAFS